MFKTVVVQKEFTFFPFLGFILKAMLTLNNREHFFQFRVNPCMCSYMSLNWELFLSCKITYILWEG